LAHNSGGGSFYIVVIAWTRLSLEQRSTNGVRDDNFCPENTTSVNSGAQIDQDFIF
jgi:hypothetical protein